MWISFFYEEEFEKFNNSVNLYAPGRLQFSTESSSIDLFNSSSFDFSKTAELL